MKSPAAFEKIRGFTLLEMAVVMVIVGVMVGLISQTQNAVGPSGCYVETKRQLQVINAAIETFARNNNRFPIPAGRSLGVKSPTYGREAPSTTDASIDRYATGSPASTNPVDFGALPFQALGLPESYASDCWGNKFSYIVTEKMTSNADVGGYPDVGTKGGITLMSNDTTKIADATASSGLAWAVISHGENGAKAGGGAVARNYSSASHGWCTVTASNGFDTNNCDVTGTAPAPTVIYDAEFNNGPNAGAKYFDDVMIYSSRYLNPASNLYCWGTGSSGQMGNGTNADSVTPTPVNKASGIKAYAKVMPYSSQTVYAIGDDDNLYYWGSGTAYTGTNQSTPVKLTSPVSSPIVSIVNGYDFMFIMTASGLVYFYEYATWNPMASTVQMVAIASSRYHMCALGIDGKAYCWGHNWAGQLGDGLTGTDHSPTPPSAPPYSYSPVTMPSGVIFTKIATGYDHTCAIGNDGNGYCWGGNAGGQLGNGSYTDSGTPVLVTKPSGVNYFTDVIGGYRLSCFLSDTSNLYCDGENFDSQGARAGGNANVLTATNALPSGAKFSSLTGQRGVATDHKIYSWGLAWSNQIGNGTAPYATNTPTAPTMPSVTGFKQSGSYDSGGCGMDEGTQVGGQVYAWGDNSSSQLGNAAAGSSTNAPVKVTFPPAARIVDAQMGVYHACALTMQGDTYCWGASRYGRLGFGRTSIGYNWYSTPQQVMPAIAFSSISVGDNHTCGLTAKGTAYCWGLNDNGQIGNNSVAEADYATPVDMAGIPGVTYFKAISAGADTTCAIGSDDNIYCWGKNDVKQYGNGGTAEVHRPTAANKTSLGGLTAKSVRVGVGTVCAILSDLKPYCWGNGSQGELGNGTTSASSTPSAFQIPASRTATSIATGYQLTCVILDNGATYCSGNLPAPNYTTATPMALPSMPSGVTAYTSLNMGSTHICAIGNDNLSYCFGQSANGLGDGSTTNSGWTPVKSSLSGFGVTQVLKTSSRAWQTIVVAK